VLDSIKAIEKELIEPRKVLPLFACDVYTFQVTDRLSDLLHVIYEKGFTKFPIYEGNEFRGLISQKGITSWFATKADDIPWPKEVLLKEVLECVELNNYKFLKSNASVYRAEEIFREQIGKGNRIEALLITRKSSFKEDLKGIITNWDIMKV
jgi:CBS domain-containing protein